MSKRHKKQKRRLFLRPLDAENLPASDFNPWRVLPRCQLEETPLQALIAKYRYHAEFEERDLIDINRQPYPDADLLIHLVARVGSPDELDLLFRSGARVNAPGDMGFTALHNAAGTGRIKVVEKLLALGADPKRRNNWGDTPEETALNGGYVDVAKLLNRHKHRK